jgi:hypothetical protein
MRGVASVAAGALAVLGYLCSVDDARSDPVAGESEPHFLFYSGTDLWRFGAFMHGGVLWSPDGLYHEGFTLKLLVAGGTYRYLAGNDNVTGRQALASVLPGWRFKQERFETTVYLGLDAQDHRLSPDDIGNPLRGTHFGLRFAADVWLEPTDVMMVSSAFSASTIQSSYWGRAQIGGRIPDVGWIGPEAQLFSDLGYHQYSVGLHLTGFKTAEFEWSFGGGYVIDINRRTGAYGRLGLNVRR